jgi:hypothetical protein
LPHQAFLRRIRPQQIGLTLHRDVVVLTQPVDTFQADITPGSNIVVPDDYFDRARGLPFSCGHNCSSSILAINHGRSEQEESNRAVMGGQPAEFKPAKVRFAKNLSQGITIRLDEDTLSELCTLAHDKGIGPTTMIRRWIRMWVLERIKQESHPAHRETMPK